MEDAWMVDKDGSRIFVTATEVQRKYNGHVPTRVCFVCPICCQPLKTAAMSFGSLQSPHFRHKSNNPEAQECERFSRGGEWASPALQQSMPLPMFIRRRSVGSSSFVVEGGFRSPDDDVLKLLQSVNSKLCVGSREYVVDERRFGGGIVRIPFDEVSIRPRESVALRPSPLPIERIWGMPEDAERMMIFTRDIHTGQGMRVRKGESVEFGAPVYILLPKAFQKSVLNCFAKCKHEGFVEHRLGANTLQVLSASIPRFADIGVETFALLRREEISICEKSASFDVVWPPSLLVDGDIRPVLKASEAIFYLEDGTVKSKGIYVYQGTAKNDEARFVSAEEVHKSAHGFVTLNILHSGAVLTTEEDVFADAVLIEQPREEYCKRLENHAAGFELSDSKDGISIRLTRSLIISWLKKSLSDEVFSGTGKLVRCNMRSGDVIRIVKKLYARSGNATLSQTVRLSKNHLRMGTREISDVDVFALKSECKGIAFATLRDKGRKQAGQVAKGKMIALARRTS